MKDSKTIEMFDLKKRKEEAQKLITNYRESKIKEQTILDEALKYDDTNPNIHFEILIAQKKLIYKNIEKAFDILPKEDLNKFEIYEENNYKDIYYNFLDFIIEIKLAEPINADNNCELESFENDSLIKEIEENDDNLSDSEFKKYLEKKQSFSLKSYFVNNHKFKVKELKEKFKKIYDNYYEFLNYRNNYPDFKSEYFYYNMLRYILENFSKLKYRRFISKINLIKSLKRTVKLMKNELIKDILIQKFFFYVINTQYILDTKFLDRLISYIPDEYDSLNHIDNFIVDKEKNILTLKKENIIFQNYDLYKSEIFTDNDLLDTVKNNNENLSVLKNFYGLKGLLFAQSFKKEIGDKYWDDFLSSKVLEDIFKLFYPKILNTSFFKENIIKDFIKENSFYFPNNNSDFLALTSKDILMVYLPPMKAKINDFNLLNSIFTIIIDHALNKNNIHHEWGHFSSSFLFCYSNSNIFNSPKREIKIYNEEKNNLEEFEIIDEAGDQVETLLYNRVIEGLNFKEALYILDNRNYSKSLEEYRKGFMNLKTQTIIEIYKDIIDNNKEIEQCVIDGYIVFMEDPEVNSKNLEKAKWSTKKAKGKLNDIENLNIKIKRSSHHRPYVYKKHK